MPNICPAALRTVTVAPGSPVPVMLVPLPLIVAVGTTGGVMSGAAAVAGGETFPAASLCTTVTGWPLVWGGLTGMLKVPSVPTVPVPITLPAPSVTRTVAPASPVPRTLAPLAVKLAVGVAGGCVSTEGPGWFPPLPPPPATAATSPPTPATPNMAGRTKDDPPPSCAPAAPSRSSRSVIALNRPDPLAEGLASHWLP